jgi:hypothetical protein
MDRPLRLQEVKAPRISRQSAHEGGTGCLYPHEIFLVLTLFKAYLEPRGHMATGRIKSTKNSNDPIGNRTRYRPAL